MNTEEFVEYVRQRRLSSLTWQKRLETLSTTTTTTTEYVTKNIWSRMEDNLFATLPAEFIVRHKSVAGTLYYLFIYISTFTLRMVGWISKISQKHYSLMVRTRFAFYPPVRISSSQISSHFTGSPFRSSQMVPITAVRFRINTGVSNTRAACGPRRSIMRPPTISWKILIYPNILTIG